MIKKIGLALVLAALSSAASAGGSGGFTCTTDYFDFLGVEIPYEVCTAGGGGSQATAAPEIDPASVMAGLTLALGGLAVLRGRRYKNTEQ